MTDRVKAIAYDLVDGLGRWKSTTMIHFNIDPPLTNDEVNDMERAVIEEFKAHGVEPFDFELGMQPDKTAVMLRTPYLVFETKE